MLVVKIRHLRGEGDYEHYFYDTVFNDLTVVGLSQFFARKAKESFKDIDSTWDYTAYKFAEVMVLRFNKLGKQQTLDWSLELKEVALEKL